MWRKTLAESAWFHTKATLAIMPVFVAGFDYIGCPQKVSGRSMQPTFNASATSNWVWLNKWRGLGRDYSRGDVVVLRSPSEPGELLTKRVIALAGDFVYRRDDRALVQIPKGHVWVEGDNGPNSNDSNSFGSVPAGLVEAVITFRLHPVNDAGRVERREAGRDRVIPGRKRDASEL